MGFVIRNLSPALLGALAAETGDEYGRALVDRAVFEHEMALEEAARQQAFRRPGEATPINRLAGTQIGLTPKQPGAAGARYSPFRDGPLGPSSTTLAEPGTPTNPIRPFGGAQPGQPVAAAPAQPRQPATVAPQAQPAAPRPAGTSAATDPLERVRDVSARRRPSGNAQQDAARVLAGAMDEADLAGLLAPAFNSGPRNIDTGEPEIDLGTGQPALYGATERTTAANLLRAIDGIADDLSAHGTKLHSLSDLVKRYDGLKSSGIPDTALAGMRAGIERRSQEAALAVREALRAVRKAETDARVRAGPGGAADPARTIEAKIKAQTLAAAKYGLSREQLLDAMRFLAAHGVRFEDPSAPGFTGEATPGGGENVNFTGR